MSGAPDLDSSRALLYQPGLHGCLGDAKAPQVMLGPNRSPIAFSHWRKPVLSKRFLLSKMRMLLSPSAPSLTQTTQNQAQTVDRVPLCTRKPAIFIGAKPQMETEISVSPFNCTKKLNKGPGSGTNTRGGYFSVNSQIYHFSTS